MQVGADNGVGRHAAGGHQGPAAGKLQGAHGAGHQFPGHGAGKVPGKCWGVQRLALLLGVVRQVHHSGLQAGKTHVQLCPGHMGAGQVVHAACGLLRQLVHRPAAGVGEPQHPRRLVEAFAGGIVTGGTQHGHIGVVRHIHDQRIAAGDGQRHEGRLQLRKGQIVGGDVPPHMVHRNQGHTQRVGSGFGKADAHQHRADEPRRIRHRHRVQISAREVRLDERLVRQRVDRLDGDKIKVKYNRDGKEKTTSVTLTKNSD